MIKVLFVGRQWHSLCLINWWLNEVYRSRTFEKLINDYKVK